MKENKNVKTHSYIFIPTGGGWYNFGPSGVVNDGILSSTGIKWL